MKKKRGQVTIFIIIAIILVSAVVLFFVFKESIITEKIPSSIEPIYTSFLFCLEEDLATGIDVLESQGGYVEVPDFEPGSAYMPFSNQLDFLGNPVPYWYYVSGNNIQKEQVPSKGEMEEELEDFVESRARGCRFEDYYEQGFEITQGEPEADIVIKDNEVKISLDMNFEVNKEEDSALIENHRVTVKSKLGKLYGSAREIYDKEQDDLFLENYAVDTLRLYAPVDGVELTCSPLVWNAEEVFDELQEAIEANTLALKTKGSADDYFVVDVSVDEEVRFLNSKAWPYTFEVAPSEGGVLMASSVGNQPGLGILGFCYVPYHFVYDVKYPVLIQVQDGDEIFQFPVAVVVQGNMPRQALEGSAVEVAVPELCKYKNTLISVNTYDTRLNPVEAYVTFECLGTKCEIGKTEFGNLETEFPQCVNGYISVNAEGFEEADYLVSTVEPASVDVILDRLYELEVVLKLDGRSYNEAATISFISDASSKTIVYPEQKNVELSEGDYEVHVYIYKDSSLKIEATTTEQCVKVPKAGLGGIFGLNDEKCFEVDMPEQIVSSALAGGGKENYYILESELEGANVLEINAESLPTPTSLEQLQTNYILFEDKGLDIVFK